MLPMFGTWLLIVRICISYIYIFILSSVKMTKNQSLSPSNEVPDVSMSHGKEIIPSHYPIPLILRAVHNGIPINYGLYSLYIISNKPFGTTHYFPTRKKTSVSTVSENRKPLLPIKSPACAAFIAPFWLVRYG